MGFSYTQYGLACDLCPAYLPSAKIKKVPCPFGYCQAWAACEVCRESGKTNQCSCTPEKATHKQVCKPLAEKFKIDHPEIKI